YFSRDVDDPVTREHDLAVETQRIDVGAQQTVERLLHRSPPLGAGLADDQRYVLDEALPAVDPFRQFFHRPDVSPGSRPIHEPLGHGPGFRRQALESRAIVDTVVPRLQVTHFGIASNAPAVRAHAVPGSGFTLRLVASQRLRRDRRTGGQAFEIPL